LPTAAAVIIAIASISALCFKYYSLVQGDLLPKLAVPSLDVPGAAPPAPGGTSVRTDTSIAFYIVCGAAQTITGDDLRGKFWEWQLPQFTGNYSLQYLSDAPLSVNGIDFLVLPEGSDGYDDTGLCIRTPESWGHFVARNSAMRWYFRGTHDTLVNLTALSTVIADLEAKGDPMTTLLFAFNVHEWNNSYYPQGGTGWLMSNFAVRQCHFRVQQFAQLCRETFDDVAMTTFLAGFGIQIMDWRSSKFIVTWPTDMLDVIFQKEWSKVQKCPKTYSLYPGGAELVPGYARQAAAIHMHQVPMEKAWKVLEETPLDYGVYFPDPDTPTFCQIAE
jgi:hypothetical protein